MNYLSITCLLLDLVIVIALVLFMTLKAMGWYLPPELWQILIPYIVPPCYDRAMKLIRRYAPTTSLEVADAAAMKALPHMMPKAEDIYVFLDDIIVLRPEPWYAFRAYRYRSIETLMQVKAVYHEVPTSFLQKYPWNLGMLMMRREPLGPVIYPPNMMTELANFMIPYLICCDKPWVQKYLDEFTDLPGVNPIKWDPKIVHRPPVPVFIPARARYKDSIPAGTKIIMHDKLPKAFLDAIQSGKLLSH